MRCTRFAWLPLVPLCLAANSTAAREPKTSWARSPRQMIVEDSHLVGDVTCATAIPVHPVRRAEHRAAPERVHDHGSCEPRRHDDLPGHVRSSGRGRHQQRHERRQQPGRRTNHRPRHGAEVQAARHLDRRSSWRQHQCDGEDTSPRTTIVSAGCWPTWHDDSIIEDIVSVRNAANSGGAPCGGNCLISSTTITS